MWTVRAAPTGLLQASLPLPSFLRIAALTLLLGCATPRTEVTATFPAGLLRDGLKGEVKVCYETTWFGRDVIVERDGLKVVVSSDPSAARDERDRETARLLEALRLVGGVK